MLNKREMMLNFFYVYIYECINVQIYIKYVSISNVRNGKTFSSFFEHFFNIEFIFFMIITGALNRFLPKHSQQ